MAGEFIENKKSFMGFDYGLEKSKAVIILAPYEKTATYKKGQASGPSAFIEASNQVETYDIELKQDFIDSIGFHTLKELKIKNLKVEKAIEEVYKATKKVFEKQKFPIIVGGEHSISFGPIKAANEFYSNLSVLQIDAHADMRKEYEGSKYNHACVMARVREIVPAISVGIRSYCIDEAKEIEQKYKDCIYHHVDLQTIKKVVEKLTENVYITIDIDGFDPSIMPGTGTPEPDGLLWNEALSLLREVTKQKKVIGFDIMELAPIKGENITEFNCAKLAYKLAGYCFIR
jgi:agmatinase